MLYIYIGIGIAVAAIIAYFVLGDSESSKKPTEGPKLTNVTDSIWEEVPIYFSSQTGTAERFCEMFSEDAIEFGLNTKVINLQDFDKDSFEKQKFAIFILATHYEGEAPDNAVDFHDKYLLEEEKSDLSHMKYLMYGLGDKTYKNFGGFSKTVDAALKERNAVGVTDLIIGSDHQATIEDHYVEWKNDIQNKIKEHLPLREGVCQDKIDQLPQRKKSSIGYEQMVPKFTAEICNDEIDYKSVSASNWRNCKDHKIEDFELNPGKIVYAYDAKVQRVYDLREKNAYVGELLTGRSLGIDLEVGIDSDFNWETSGNLMIFPENTEKSVRAALKCIGMRGKEMIKLTENGKASKLPFPRIIQTELILKKFLDLHGKLKGSLIKKLAKCITDPSKRDMLLKQTEKNNADFQDMVSKRWSLIQLIENYNITLELSELIDVCERIKPRYFTISSSERKNQKKISLAITLTIDAINDNSNTHYGLSSQYWSDLYDAFENKTYNADNYCYTKVAFQTSALKLPKEANTNCLMIGSGAGVAPFIGMLEDKAAGNKNFGNMSLVYGFRKSTEDFMFNKELKQWKADETLTNGLYAISRDGDKKYVQDLLKENIAVQTSHLFDKNSRIYVCGNQGMATACRKLFEQCFVDDYGMSQEQAEKKQDELVKQEQRVNIEAWG